MILSAIGMALSEVRRNTLRSILTMLGMVIGVAAVISMVTLGQAATNKVTAEISSLGNNLLMISPGAERRGPPTGVTTPFDLTIVKAVEREVGTRGDVAPVSSATTLAVYGNVNHSTNVQGSVPAFLTVKGYDLDKGRFFTTDEANSGRSVCVIGSTVESELFGRKSALGETIRLGATPCSIIGVLESKGASSFGPDQDDLIVMPIVAVQRRLQGNDNVESISVSVHETSQINKVSGDITEVLRVKRRIVDGKEDDFAVRDMREIMETLSTTTTLLTAFLGAVGSISLLVGGIGIMNIMLVSVTERTREIGIRLAIGAKAGDILSQFLVEAIVLCLLGGTGGIVLGLSASGLAIYFFGLPFSVNVLVVAGSFIFCGMVGVVFGFLPARRASQLDPIEALRHD